MLDQRKIRSSFDQYYFQLIPQELMVNKKNNFSHSRNANFSFRLMVMKGYKKCDEQKQGLKFGQAKEKLSFENTQLAFYLQSYNPNRNIEFPLILLKKGDNENEVEIGKYRIKSSDFILQFKNFSRKLFEQTVPIGDDYQLSFKLYLNKSKAEIDKFIKESKELPEQKYKNASPLSNGKSAQNSQKTGNFDNEICQSNQFVRKPDRNLLRRSNSPLSGKISQCSRSKPRQLKFMKKSPCNSPRRQMNKPCFAEQHINMENKHKKEVFNTFKQTENKTTKKKVQNKNQNCKRSAQYLTEDKQIKKNFNTLVQPVKQSQFEEKISSKNEQFLRSENNLSLQDLLNFEQSFQEIKKVEKAKKKKHHSKELIRLTESYKIYSKEKKQNEIAPQAKPSLNTSNISIKMVIFLIIGFMALYYVMFPSRKF